MNADSPAIAGIAGAACISFTTCRRNAQAVPTTPWSNTMDGKIHITTPAQLWRAKQRRYRVARLTQMLPANRDQIGIEIVAGVAQGGGRP